jgi:HPt (histidine-containing phosphotransfer) domain-containing protein
MAGHLSPQAQSKLASLTELQQRVHRIHSLVEQFAAAKTGHETLAQPIRRAFQQLRVQCLSAGYDALAQLCGSMELAAGRGGPITNKVRILREGVGSLRSQVELEQRSIRAAARPSTG